MYHDSIPVSQLGITPPEYKDSDKFEIWYIKRDFKNFHLESSVKICQCWVKKISSLLWEEAAFKKRKFSLYNIVYFISHMKNYYIFEFNNFFQNYS